MVRGRSFASQQNKRYLWLNKNLISILMRKLIDNRFSSLLYMLEICFNTDRRCIVFKPRFGIWRLVC